MSLNATKAETGEIVSIPLKGRRNSDAEPKWRNMLGHTTALGSIMKTFPTNQQEVSVLVFDMTAKILKDNTGV